MFDEKKARRVIRFIECLKHTKGEFHGKPFKLLPWQEKIIRDVFGTVRDEDPSMRQYQQAAIVFDVAVDMVRQNPTLSKLIKIIQGIAVYGGRHLKGGCKMRTA